MLSWGAGGQRHPQSTPLHCYPGTEGELAPPRPHGGPRTQLLLVRGGQLGIESHVTVSVATSDTVTKTFLRYSKERSFSPSIPVLWSYSFPSLIRSTTSGGGEGGGRKKRK